MKLSLRARFILAEICEKTMNIERENARGKVRQVSYKTDPLRSVDPNRCTGVCDSCDERVAPEEGIAHLFKNDGWLVLCMRCEQEQLRQSRLRADEIKAKQRG